MAERITRRSRSVLSGGLHPHYAEVVRTMAADGHEMVSLAANPAGPVTAEQIAGLIDDATACVVVQSPDVFGNIVDLAPIAAATHARGALLVVVVTEVVSLGAIEPPGHQGADIVVGEGQSLGVGLNFGGPYLGLFATREKYVRQMPGRLCGETVDAEGRRGFVLTLSTREQHIRREKATSNICTNAGLCSLAFTIHLSLLGETGLGRLAGLNHKAAVTLEARLAQIKGVQPLNATFFNEFALRLPRPAALVVEELAARGVLGGVPASRLWPDEPALADVLIVAATETNTEADIERFASALAEVL
jgi:glycine dehydrogenase subunit 1